MEDVLIPTTIEFMDSDMNSLSLKVNTVVLVIQHLQLKQEMWVKEEKGKVKMWLKEVKGKAICVYKSSLWRPVVQPPEEWAISTCRPWHVDEITGDATRMFWTYGIVVV